MNDLYNQADGQTSYALHPISNYTFGTKAPKVEKDTSVKERLDRMKHKYETHTLKGLNSSQIRQRGDPLLS